jgi:hypothetical protein
MKVKFLFLWFIIYFASTVHAENEFLSLTCVKGITTYPGDISNALSLESLSSTLKELDKNEIDPLKIKSDLNEYLDPKLIKIEFGTDSKSRASLKKNYNVFIDKLDKICETIKNSEKKEDLKKVRNLRIFSYQALTRSDFIQDKDKNEIPFGIEEASEAVSQLLNIKPQIYNKTLELLQFSGLGDYYGALPVRCAGLELTDFMDICLILNNNIKNESLLNLFKRSCGVINATAGVEGRQQKFSYSRDVSGQKEKVEVELKALGGIPKKTFEKIREALDEYKFDVDDDLKLSAKIIYLNSAWSVGIIPIVLPLLEEGGLAISVVSSPNDLDTSTDITEKFYSKESATSSSIIRAFFDLCQTSQMDITNANNGFCPYFILKNKLGRFFLHYFLDPKLTDFVQGFEKRDKTKPANIISKEKFSGLQDFNEKYNADENPLIERIFIWHCCWHAPITEDVIKTATDEALKLKSLLRYMQDNNIYLKAHDTFEEFQKLALSLFEE